MPALSIFPFIFWEIKPTKLVLKKNHRQVHNRKTKKLCKRKRNNLNNDVPKAEKLTEQEITHNVDSAGISTLVFFFLNDPLYRIHPSECPFPYTSLSDHVLEYTVAFHIPEVIFQKLPLTFHFTKFALPLKT